MPAIRNWRLRPCLERAVALTLIASLYLVGGPSRAGDPAAVWVPLAPAGAQVEGPVVLVPFAQTLHLPEPGTSPMPWVPEYLSPRAATTLPETAARRLRNLPRRDEFGLVGAGYDLSEQGGESGEETREAPAAAGFTLSDVVRDVNWRRDTAERLRTQPGFRLPY